jgi:hypothetical protein
MFVWGEVRGCAFLLVGGGRWGVVKGGCGIVKAIYQLAEIGLGGIGGSLSSL